MKNSKDLNIESFLLLHRNIVAIEYFFEQDREMTSIEIPLSLFNLWLIHNHNQLRLDFTYEGEISWIDMFYYEVPKHIQREYIMHYEKCKHQSEQEAA